MEDVAHALCWVGALGRVEVAGSGGIGLVRSVSFGIIGSAAFVFTLFVCCQAKTTTIRSQA
jgi:hypothetical protein